MGGRRPREKIPKKQKKRVMQKWGSASHPDTKSECQEGGEVSGRVPQTGELLTHWGATCWQRGLGPPPHEFLFPSPIPFSAEQEVYVCPVRVLAAPPAQCLHIWEESLGSRWRAQPSVGWSLSSSHPDSGTP